MSSPPTIAVTLGLAHRDHGRECLWRGICRFAREQGWRLVLDPYADVKPARAYDGVLSHGNIANPEDRPDVPTVLFQPRKRRKDVSQVVPDFFGAGRMAARHLLARDYHSFGIFGKNHHLPSWQMMRAFRDTAIRKGSHIEWMIYGCVDFRSSAVWERFSASLDTWFAEAEPPVGVFGTTDQLARHLADAAERAGLRVPEDVAVVGAGNDPAICEALEPGLSSIEFGFESVGYRAAATVAEALDGKGTIRRRVRPECVVARASTDREFFDDPVVVAALGWIAAHCREPIRVEDVAEGIQVPLWRLRKLMRASRRHTVVHAIAQARLRVAMSLLESSDLSVELVARNAGYGSLGAMGKAFREHLHSSPTAYRDLAGSGTLPPSSPIEHAKRLLQQTPWSVGRIALVTGYEHVMRLHRAFRRHFGTTPGVWRSVHGTPAVKKLTKDPEPTWPGVRVVFVGPDGEEEARD